MDFNHPFEIFSFPYFWMLLMMVCGAIVVITVTLIVLRVLNRNNVVQYKLIEVKESSGEIICPYCDTKNISRATYCINCGRYISNKK